MTSPSRSPAQPNRAPKPRWHGLFTLLFALVMHTSSLAQDRAELVNRSSQPWTLALVEGTHASVGSLTLVDKFTGKISASLAKVGDAAILPARAHLLVIFNREGGYMNRDFILKDTLGYYAEYRATVEFLSTPRISINLVDHHLGAPMDHSDDEAVKQFLEDAIEIGSENIIIHPNYLSEPEEKVRMAGNYNIYKIYQRPGN